jgi:hypothetical protein
LRAYRQNFEAMTRFVMTATPLQKFADIGADLVQLIPASPDIDQLRRAADVVADASTDSFAKVARSIQARRRGLQMATKGKTMGYRNSSGR